jgi:hypothetical protein
VICGIDLLSDVSYGIIVEVTENGGGGERGVWFHLVL